jgi:OOP family OmpA-OmpF porin
MRVLSCLSALALLSAPAVSASQPAPQYKAEDLERRFGADAAATCEAQGLVTGAGGECLVRKGDTRGFSLVAPETQSAAPPARTPGAGARRIAPASQRTASPSRPAAMRPTPARAAVDLLLTFENNSATLTEQARANAHEFAVALKRGALSSARFAIDGHTDAVGSRAHNQRLSAARAEALVDFLASEGVDRSRFEVRGHGFDQPLRGSDPRAAENRRVEARRLS